MPSLDRNVEYWCDRRHVWSPWFSMLFTHFHWYKKFIRFCLSSLIYHRFIVWPNPRVSSINMPAECHIDTVKDGDSFLDEAIGIPFFLTLHLILLCHSVYHEYTNRLEPKFQKQRKLRIWFVTTKYVVTSFPLSWFILPFPSGFWSFRFTSKLFYLSTVQSIFRSNDSKSNLWYYRHTLSFRSWQFILWLTNSSNWWTPSLKLSVITQCAWWFRIPPRR